MWQVRNRLRFMQYQDKFYGAFSAELLLIAAR